MDELKQLPGVVQGKILLVGSRGWSAGELDDLETFFKNAREADVPKLGLWMMAHYQRIMDIVRPKSAVMGTHSAMRSKSTPFLPRCLGDYWTCVAQSPWTDYRVAVKSMGKMLHGVGAK